MTITVRGTPAWAASFTAPSWPTGSGAGDVAFLFLHSQNKTLYTNTIYHTRPSGWESTPIYAKEYDDGTNRYSFTVYRQVVPAGGPVALPDPSTVGDYASRLNYLRAMLVVFSGASAVDTVISGAPYVQVAAGGAALCVKYTSPATLYSNTSGVTDLATLGQVGAIWDTNDGASAAHLGWNTSNVNTWAFEILPKAAPSKPTITAPAQSAGVPTGEDVPVTIQHNTGVVGGSMKAYRLRGRQDAGTWYYWNQSAGTLSSTTAVDNTATGTTVTVTLPNAVVTGTTIELIAETQEAVDDQRSPVSDTRTFTRVAPPTVVVTGPGALTGDLTPTITWVTTPAPGLAQTDYRVVITDAGGAVLDDPGTIAGTGATYTAPGSTAWVSGATVTATVTVTQTGGAQASDADTFSVSWTAPTAPTVAATVASQGITVVVTAAASRLIRVWRRSGTTDALLGEWLTGTDDVLTFVDVFGPTTAVTYRAQVWSDLDGVLLPSAVATSSPVTRTDNTTCYIGSAMDPAQTWREADLREEADRTHVRPVGVVWPIGGVYSRTLSGLSRGRVGGFTAYATDGVDLDSIVDLLECGDTLLVRIGPESYGSGSKNAGQVIPLSVTTKVGEARLVQGPHALRILSFEWAERAWPEPTGLTTAPVTHAAVLS